MSVLQVKTSELFERNYTAPTRIVVNQGGSRSGKTYSILQMLIVIAMQEKGKVFSIVRKSLPSLKMTAYRDFFEILRNMELYDETRHNKSDYTYTLNGNLFEFIKV